MSSTQHNGFIDLRVGHGARGIGDDSVWPSFTDIMTVIVMIFLMALVVMLVRNFELDRQLVSTETARDAGLAENRGLLEKIGVLESGVRDLRSSLDTSRGERDALQAQLLDELNRIEQMAADNLDLEGRLADTIRERERLAGEKQELAVRSEARIAALAASEADLGRYLAAMSRQFDDLKLRSAGEIKTLSGANLTLTGQLDQVVTQLEQLKALLRTEQQERRALGLRVEAQERELADKQELLAQLQTVQENSTQRYAEARAQIDRLNDSIRRRRQETDALRQLADAADQRFRSLQEEYEALEAQYRTLVRPARSPAGKYVVDVWILKSDDRYRYRLREPEHTGLVEYTRTGLDRRLAALRAEHGPSLYTKVVIPENSSLSHNEAWRFTQEILQGYDYYYQ